MWELLDYGVFLLLQKKIIFQMNSCILSVRYVLMYSVEKTVFVTEASNVASIWFGLW